MAKKSRKIRYTTHINYQLLKFNIMKNSAKEYTITHIDPKKGFRIHLLVFALTIPVIWLTWFLTDTTYLWPVWQISAWGTGLLFHYLGVFVFKNKKQY